MRNKYQSKNATVGGGVIRVSQKTKKKEKEEKRSRLATEKDSDQPRKIILYEPRNYVDQMSLHESFST